MHELEIMDELDYVRTPCYSGISGRGAGAIGSHARSSGEIPERGVKRASSPKSPRWIRERRLGGKANTCPLSFGPPSFLERDSGSLLNAIQGIAGGPGGALSGSGTNFV